MNSREQDILLLKAIRQGDKGAFERLYQRYAPGLLSYVLQRVPNRAEAEELVQETFIRLLRDKRFEPDRASLGTYLYVIARNLAYNHVRDHLGRRHVSMEEQPQGASAWVDPGEVPEEVTGKREQLVRMQEVLGALPEVQREAFMLRHHHGHSYQEIAEISGIPVGTAKSRVHLAVTALREALEPALENVRPLMVAVRRGG